ncbi:MAG: hypothetical protein ACJAYU_002622 [Bradymonadia bacterium]
MIRATAYSIDTTCTIDVLDLDGTAEDFSVEVGSSGASTEFATREGTELTLPAGEHTGGLTFVATATDNFGAATSRRFSLVFAGSECNALETFDGTPASRSASVSLGMTAVVSCSRRPSPTTTGTMPSCAPVAT